MLIVVAADKGAPGVTTSCLALALVWPRRVLLAECDPSGADLPWRLPASDGRPLVQGKGLVSLATSTRGQAHAIPGWGVQSGVVQGGALGGLGHRVWDHVQHLDGGLPVLVGPPAPEQAEAMGSAWGTVADLLGDVEDADVIADCGRLLSGGSPAAALLSRADLVVLITRATVSGVAHTRRGLTGIARLLNDAPRPVAGSSSRSGLGRLAVVVVADPTTPGRRRAQQRDVGDVLAQAPGLQDIPVAGVLAHDPRAAAALSGHPTTGRGIDRSALLTSATTVAQGLLERAQQISEGAVNA